MSSFIRYHLNEITTMKDLANYLVISALMSKPREYLIQKVIKSTNFSVITHDYPEARSIIEHFLNGNNNEF